MLELTRERSIFLNLAFSNQAAFAAPLILVASNQAAVRDRATLEHAANEAEEADQKDDELTRAARADRCHDQVAGS